MAGRRPKQMPAACAAILAATVAAGAFAPSARGQEKVVEPVSASTSIFQPILIAKNADLSFGTVTRPVTGPSTVTIDASTGAQSVTGDSQALGGDATPARARFTVTGEGGQAYTITTPASMSLTRAGGSETLSVSLTPTLTTGALPGAIGATGSVDLGVGGRVTLAPTTVIGAYSGSFTVIVAYN